MQPKNKKQQQRNQEASNFHTHSGRSLLVRAWWSESSAGARARRWRRASERGGAGGAGRCPAAGSWPADPGSSGRGRPPSDPARARSAAAPRWRGRGSSRARPPRRWRRRRRRRPPPTPAAPPSSVVSSLGRRDSCDGCQLAGRGGSSDHNTRRGRSVAVARRTHRFGMEKYRAHVGRREAWARRRAAIVKARPVQTKSAWPNWRLFSYSLFFLIYLSICLVLYLFLTEIYIGCVAKIQVSTIIEKWSLVKTNSVLQKFGIHAWNVIDWTLELLIYIIVHGFGSRSLSIPFCFVSGVGGWVIGKAHCLCTESSRVLDLLINLIGCRTFIMKKYNWALNILIGAIMS